MMIKFKDYYSITEGRSPMWVKVVVGGLALKIKNLSNQINTEEDPIKQNKLISQQNTLLSYISGLGIGFSSDNPKMVQYMRSLSRRK